MEMPKCHKAGEKCTGASGYAAVPWLGCCNEMTCAVRARDWDTVFEKAGKTTSAPATTTVAKCAKEGTFFNGRHPV